MTGKGGGTMSTENYYQRMFVDYPDIVNIRDLMKMLAIGRNKALELVNTKQIKGILIGNRYRIPKWNVIRYLMNETEQAS